MIHLHQWSKWRAEHHYTDSSWGGNARSTLMIRRCQKCGAVRSKGLYGVVLLLEDEDPSP